MVERDGGPVQQWALSGNLCRPWSVHHGLGMVVFMGGAFSTAAPVAVINDSFQDVLIVRLRMDWVRKYG